MKCIIPVVMAGIIAVRPFHSLVVPQAHSLTAARPLDLRPRRLGPHLGRPRLAHVALRRLHPARRRSLGRPRRFERRIRDRNRRRRRCSGCCAAESCLCRNGAFRRRPPCRPRRLFEFSSLTCTRRCRAQVLCVLVPASQPSPGFDRLTAPFLPFAQHPHFRRSPRTVRLDRRADHELKGRGRTRCEHAVSRTLRRAQLTLLPARSAERIKTSLSRQRCWKTDFIEGSDSPSFYPPAVPVLRPCSFTSRSVFFLFLPSLFPAKKHSRLSRNPANLSLQTLLAQSSESPCPHILRPPLLRCVPLFRWRCAHELLLRARSRFQAALAAQTAPLSARTSSSSFY